LASLIDAFARLHLIDKSRGTPNGWGLLQDKVQVEWYSEILESRV